MGRGLGGELGELLGIDADRENGSAGSAMARMDDAATDGEPEILLHVEQKILAILLGLETDQIVGQHRLDQLAMMRHAADHAARAATAYAGRSRSAA